MLLSSVLVLGSYLPGAPVLGLMSYVVGLELGIMWLVCVPLVGAVVALAFSWAEAEPLLVGGRCGGVARSGRRARHRAEHEERCHRHGAHIELLDAFGVGPAPGVRPDADVTCTTFAGHPLKFAVFRPRAPWTGAAPILFYVHGGGWIGGGRLLHSGDLRWLADHGLLVLSAEYSLSTKKLHLWHAVQGQIGCALVWTTTHARRYGGDPGRVSLTGDSAGGNLALDTAYLSAAGKLPSSCGGRTPRISAVTALYPIADPAALYHSDVPIAGSIARDMATDYTGGSPERYPERYAAITPASHLTHRPPPTLLVAPENDHLVPKGGTIRLAEAARRAGVTVELVEVPFADHGFDATAGSIGEQAYRQLTLHWLARHGRVAADSLQVR